MLSPNPSPMSKPHPDPTYPNHGARKFSLSLTLTVKAKLYYAVLVADRFEAGRKQA